MRWSPWPDAPAGTRVVGVEIDPSPRCLDAPIRTPALLLTTALAATTLAMAPALDDPAPEPESLPEGCTRTLNEVTEDPEDEVVLCEQQLFVRAGDTPVSNATSAVFSTQAPSAAPVGGAGLGGSITDIAAQGDPAHGLEVNGTFTGAVDSITIEVHVLMPNGALGSHGATPTIELDGFNVGGGEVSAAVEPGALPGTAVATFQVDDLLTLWDALGYDYDHTVEHSIRLNLSPFFFGDDGAYLYDGTDVPSNVVLNAAG